MKNKWTLTLAISTVVIASLATLMVALGLVSSVRMLDISRQYGASTWVIDNNETTMNVYIVLMIFAFASLALATMGMIFHKKMVIMSYQLWFLVSAVLSLGMAFGVLVQPLSMEFQTFKNLSDINDISSTATTGLGGNVYAAASKGVLANKPFELIIAYGFAIKAAISAFAALTLVGAIALAVIKAGQGLDSVELVQEETVEQTIASDVKTVSPNGYISSKKLERSLNMVTKAKGLLDSKAITKKEFEAIKERELSFRLNS